MPSSGPSFNPSSKGISKITGLRKALGYGDSSLPRSRALKLDLRLFRLRYRSPLGPDGFDLHDWSSQLHQQALARMADDWLDGNGNGVKYWPDDKADSKYNTLQYSKDRPLIKTLITQLLFRLNQQQYRNIMYKLQNQKKQLEAVNGTPPPGSSTEDAIIVDTPATQQSDFEDGPSLMFSFSGLAPTPDHEPVRSDASIAEDMISRLPQVNEELEDHVYDIPQSPPQPYADMGPPPAMTTSPFAQDDEDELPIDPALQDTTAPVEPKKKLTAKRTPQTPRRNVIEPGDFQRMSERQKKKAVKGPYISGTEYEEMMPPLGDAPPPQQTQMSSPPESPGLPSIEELATPSKKTPPKAMSPKATGAIPEEEVPPANVTCDIPELEPLDQPSEVRVKTKPSASRAAKASVARNKKRKATRQVQTEAARSSKKAKIKILRSSTAAARAASPDLSAAAAPALPPTPVSSVAGTVEASEQPNTRVEVPRPESRAEVPRTESRAEEARPESRASSIAGTIVGDAGPSALPRAKVPPRVELIWEIVTRKPGGGAHHRSWDTSGRFQDKTLPELRNELAADPKVRGFAFRLKALDFDFDVDYQIAFDQEGRFLLMKRKIAAFVQEWMRLHKNSVDRLIIDGEIELLVDDEEEAIGLAAMGVDEVQVDW